MHKFLRRGFWPRVVLGIVFLFEFFLFALIVALLALTILDLAHFYIGLAIVFLYDLCLLIYIHNSNVPDPYKLSWMFIVGGMPVFGSAFYFIFANKRPTRKSKKIAKNLQNALYKDALAKDALKHLKATYPDGANVANYLEEVSGLGVYENSKVTYFPLGDLVFPAMVEELKKARHYIYLEYFILEPGIFYDTILDILIQKAREGVDIKLIYDDFGSFSTLPVDYELELRRQGIEAYCFNKFRPMLNVRMNNRDHRKILVIDGHTAFTGGINIADEYINKKERFGHWKDNAIMVKGQGVYGFTLAFLSTYLLITEKPIQEVDFSYYRPRTFIEEIGGFPSNDGYVVPYNGYPIHESVGERFYISLLNKANDYVYMATPYLIIDSELKNAIILAAKQGKDVRLITPGIPDKKLVYQLTRYHYGDLLKAGVKIYEYSPGFIHEKTFLVDDRMASVGTFNLDYRSLYLHLENGCLMIDSKCLNNIKQDFLDTFALSKEVTLEDYKKMHRKKWFLWDILRLFSPFL